MLAVTLSAQAQPRYKSKVAVYVTGEVSDTYKNIISSKAVAKISQTNDYIALERSEAFLSALQQEQDYQLSGEVRLDQIAAVCARHGASYVVVMDVNCTYDGWCFMTARLVHTESGMVKKSVDDSREVRNTNDIVGLTNKVLHKMFVQSQSY